MHTVRKGIKNQDPLRCTSALNGLASVLVGISIGVFGVTLSMIGLAFTIQTGVYNGFLPVGAGVAFVGVLVSIVSAVSIKDETKKTH